MKSGFRQSCLYAIALTVILIFAVSGCAHNMNKRAVQVDAALTNSGKLAEGSFYSCLFNSYMLGVPIEQARDKCSIELLEDNKKGFGGLGNVGGSSLNFYDPAQVSAACNKGGLRGEGSGSDYYPGRGYFSWGKAVPTGYDGKPIGGGVVLGLTYEESYRKKQEWDEAASKANAKWLDTLWMVEAAQKDLEKAIKSGDSKKIADAKAALSKAEVLRDEASKKADAATKQALQDPNLGGTVRPSGESVCEQALQGAREMLRECNRTGWKNFQCQQLQAKMSHCPDPARILVDPEQGYSCGEKPDIEALRKAWVALCQERVKYGPDGPNPCTPPSIDESGHYVKGRMNDVCSDPRAYINPDRDTCAVNFQIKPFGRDIQQIIIWGINHLGGPILVPPKGNRTPVSPPGPEPEGPKPY